MINKRMRSKVLILQNYNYIDVVGVRAKPKIVVYIITNKYSCILIVFFLIVLPRHFWVNPKLSAKEIRSIKDGVRGSNIEPCLGWIES